jgi:alpha-tubulin suppressor-like RCC1 family protein
MCLEEGGNIWVWGFTNAGQLGIGKSGNENGLNDTDLRVMTPGPLRFEKRRKMKNVPRSLMQVFAGQTFTLFLDSNGQLLGCGMNDLLQLGIDNNRGNGFQNSTECSVPTVIESMEGMDIIDISCGSNHCLATALKADELHLVSWGIQKHGQLGTWQSRCQSMMPLQVEGLSGMPVKSVDPPHLDRLRSLPLFSGLRQHSNEFPQSSLLFTSTLLKKSRSTSKAYYNSPKEIDKLHQRLRVFILINIS